MTRSHYRKVGEEVVPVNTVRLIEGPYVLLLLALDLAIIHPE